MHAFARLSLALALLAVTLAHAQLYRWTDEKGRTIVSDTPPPANARNVTSKAYSAPATPPGGTEPYVLQQLRKDAPVTLYSSSRCEACDLARALLNARGVPFREVLVTTPDQAEELKKVAGAASVPAMTVGRAVQTGFEDSAYHRALDEAGYPKTGILPARHAAAPKPEAPKPDPRLQALPVDPEPAPGPYAPAAARRK